MFLFIDKSLDGMSSLIYNKITPPFPFLSKRKGTLEPSNKNCLEENFQVLFLISLIYQCFPLLDEQENYTISNGINVQTTYDYVVLFPDM